MGIISSGKSINTIPKSYSNAKIEQHKLFITGYIRHYNKLNGYHDYQFIFDVIFSFYYQGYANYIKINENQPNKNIGNFGDIVEYPPTPATLWVGWNPINYMQRQISIVDSGIDSNENVNTSIGMECVTIPFSICSKLDNALQFYSKLIQNKAICLDKDRLWNFQLKPDDKYISHILGGSLNNEYVIHINVAFKGDKFNNGIGVVFHQIGSKSFNFKEFNYTNKDIHEYYQFRKESKMVKLCVCFEFNKYVSLHSPKVKLYSTNWERMSGSSGQHEKYGPIMNTDCFVGPLDEKVGMINNIKQTHQRYRDNFKIKEIIFNDYIKATASKALFSQ